MVRVCRVSIQYAWRTQVAAPETGMSKSIRVDGTLQGSLGTTLTNYHSFTLLFNANGLRFDSTFPKRTSKRALRAGQMDWRVASFDTRDLRCVSCGRTPGNVLVCFLECKVYRLCFAHSFPPLCARTGFRYAMASYKHSSCFLVYSLSSRQVTTR